AKKCPLSMVKQIIRPKKYESIDEIKHFIEKNMNKEIEMNGAEIGNEEYIRIISQKWFNDQIINYYLQLIKKYAKEVFNTKVYVFSTYFFPSLQSKGVEVVKKWIEHLGIFDYQFLFFPIHNNSHWSFVTVNLKENDEIEYWDSLDSSYTQSFKIENPETEDLPNGMSYRIWTIIRPILLLLRAERFRLKKQLYTTKITKIRCPQQPNGIDCGLYVCLFARGRICGKTMPYRIRTYELRLKLCYEIMVGEIVYDFDHQFNEPIH
ncbi:Protease, Ulp1 family, partial [Pseudoloma neurophilia]